MEFENSVENIKLKLIHNYYFSLIINAQSLVFPANSLKAAFHFRVFHTHVYARQTLRLRLHYSGAKMRNNAGRIYERLHYTVAVF